MKTVALFQGQKRFREKIKELLPEEFSLLEFQSVLECHPNGALNQSDVFLIPEVGSECSGFELLQLIQKYLQNRPLLWMVGVDDEPRASAFESGADDYFSLPLGSEFTLKLRQLTRMNAPDLSGQLSSFPPFSLIQFLVSSQTSGQLQITGKERFSLIFEKGELIDAVVDDRHGEEVLLELLRLPTKGLCFELKKRSGGKTVKRTILQRSDHLLLSLASALDES